MRRTSIASLVAVATVLGLAAAPAAAERRLRPHHRRDLPIIAVGAILYTVGETAAKDALLRANERIPSSQYRAEIFGFEKVLYGMHEKAGGQIVDITSEQRDVWMKTLEPFHAQLANEIGGNAKALASAIEAGRKACPK